MTADTQGDTLSVNGGIPAVDVFAHVLPAGYRDRVLAANPQAVERQGFLGLTALTDLDVRRSAHVPGTRQIISNVTLAPEDFFEPDEAVAAAREGNEELADLVEQNPDLFAGAAGMLPMNDISAAVGIITDQIVPSSTLQAVQLYTRMGGKPVADPAYLPVLQAAAAEHVPVLLHPVFDPRKPDNNLIFSWEYELSQAMLQLVQAGAFDKAPGLIVVIHHAGVMAPFFAGRIDHILPRQQAQDFRRFYVDTAIIGNPKALALAVDFFGAGHVLFGTDAPFAVPPAGPTREVLDAIDRCGLSDEGRRLVLRGNYERLFGIAGQEK